MHNCTKFNKTPAGERWKLERYENKKHLVKQHWIIVYQECSNAAKKFFFGGEERPPT